MQNTQHSISAKSAGKPAASGGKKAKKKTRKLTALVAPDPTAGYLALNPETDTCTQGKTVEEALANLQEATALYLEDSPEDCPRKFAVKSIASEKFPLMFGDDS